MLYKVVLAVKSVDEILKCCRFNNVQKKAAD